MIKKHGNRFAPEKKTGNHKWIPLLLLFLLMLLSSCAAGYILGRSAFPESSGRRIDTILLTPDGDAAEQQMQQIFHLAGKINYTNGRPYAQGRVQLHSEPRETVTDTNGSFTFFHVEGGEHQIRILDRTGNVLGERKVNLFSAQAESGVNVSLQQNGQYTIEVAVDVRLMEVAIELDEKNNSLYINPEKLTYLTSDGRLVTPTGEAYYWEGTLVTPGGLVITADKTVVAPASEGPLGIALLTPENQVIYPEQDAALPDGTKLLENGNILLPGETMIERNGNGTVILTPDGLRGQPGAGGVVISGDNQVSPIGTGASGPDSNTHDNPAGPNESVSGNGYDTGTNPAERNDSSQIGNGSGGVNAGLGSGEGGESNAGSGSVSGDSSEGNDKDGGGISSGGGSGDSSGDSSGGNSGGSSGGNSGGNSGNSGGETGGDNGGGGDDKDEGPIPNFRVSWTQGQEIELFSDLSGNVQTLLPGAEGSYPFILENNNSFHVIFTLSIEEDSLHIPMHFRIVTYKDRKPLTDWWDTQNGGAAESDTVRLDAGERKSYLLEWQWPYESGKDGIDTNAGKADLDYRARLKIWAQQEGP